MSYGHLSEDELLALLLGTAGAFEAERMTPHLESCAECQARVVGLEHEQQVLGELFAAAPAAPAGLAKRVRKRLFRRPLGERLPRRWLAAAAGLALVAGGAYLLEPPPPREQMLELVRFSEARALGLVSGEQEE